VRLPQSRSRHRILPAGRKQPSVYIRVGPSAAPRAGSRPFCSCVARPIVARWTGDKSHASDAVRASAMLAFPCSRCKAVLKAPEERPVPKANAPIAVTPFGFHQSRALLPKHRRSCNTSPTKRRRRSPNPLPRTPSRCCPCPTGRLDSLAPRAAQIWRLPPRWRAPKCSAPTAAKSVGPGPPETRTAEPDGAGTTDRGPARGRSRTTDNIGIPRTSAAACR
jgi:hypothetical protein